MAARHEEQHQAEIVTQFTKQAVPFARLPGHLTAIQRLLELSRVTSEDHVLDVACGPGLVACEVAKIAKFVTGIDITASMLDQARSRQRDCGLQNLSWDLGTVSPLPYVANTFSVVLTRYSFHHVLDPKAVLEEMARVCQPNGIVVIADVALPADKVEAYNHVERLRDPSHTQALSFDAWDTLLGNSGLRNLQRSEYTVDMELEQQLAASFPRPGDADRIREIFRKDLGVDALGVGAHLVGTDVHYSYPISVYVGNK
ncbi:MAG: methyltransferase domain-containing protein [Nitrospira sp.]